MYIHRLEIRRREVSKLFYLLKQFDDATAFPNDKICQFQIVLVQVHAQKLRRPGNSGKWVFNFMRQHFGHANGRFGRRLDRVALRHPTRQFTRRNHQHHVFRRAHKRRDLQRALQWRTLPIANVDVIDKQRRAVFSRPRQTFLQRRINRQLIPQWRANHRLDRCVKKALSSRVYIDDFIGRPNHDRRNRHRRPKIPNTGHAATCPWLDANAAGNSASVAAGVLAVKTARRASVDVPAVSMNQPRCLRATRRPSKSP